ncbi:MAG: 23S rRNA (uracil(1939)-C(5))-methyltransferase RlmD [Planctomycetota bacterium]
MTARAQVRAVFYCSLKMEPLRCKHFGTCGGCSFLNTPYREQLLQKQSAVERAFAKHPELKNVRVRSIAAPENPYFYRNRLLYPLAILKGRVAGGFFKKGTHELVDVEECKIQDPSITEIASGVKKIIESLQIPIRPLPGVVSDSVIDKQTNRAAARAITVRVAQTTGEALVGIVTTAGLFPEGKEFAERVSRLAHLLKTTLNKTVRIIGVARNINDTETNVVLGSRSLPLLGRDYITERLGGFEYQISLESFFQPNAIFAKRAVDDIVRRVAAAEHVIDIYAGGGFITIPLSQKAKRVDAIEEAGTSVRDGRRNAAKNRRANITFSEGDAADILIRLRGQKIDLATVDPPRGGFDTRSLTALVELDPERIAYLSCSEVSLARDLAAICKNYQIEEVRPYDFLPHTEHIELLAFAKRRAGASG